MTVRFAQSLSFLAAITASVLVEAREYVQCSIELQAAESIIRFREQGRPKTFLTDLLPPRTAKPGDKPRPRHPTITTQMYSIIDEVYANPTIKLRAYVEYRNQSCINRTQRIKVPNTLSDIALPMAGCQEKYDSQESPELANCIRSILVNYEKNDL